VLALLLTSGCATSRGSRPSEAAPSQAAADAVLVETPVGSFRLEAPASEGDGAQKVGQAVRNAGPKLSRWGTLREPVIVRVHPNHKSLERAARRSGYAWLRAWARYDVVDVQSPRTWGLFGANQNQVDELLLHELTHSLMYQLASDRPNWRRTGIPVWFREGMASYTSDQGYRWPTLEQLTRYLGDNPGQELLAFPAEMFQEESAVVYGAAHHAFSFLVKRYGEASVRALLKEMGRGATFPAAFEHAVGLPLASFERDFSRYVRWRGFKGGRLLPRRGRLPETVAE
jgi:hypothetical protein